MSGYLTQQGVQTQPLWLVNGRGNRKHLLSVEIRSAVVCHCIMFFVRHIYHFSLLTCFCHWLRMTTTNKRIWWWWWQWSVGWPLRPANSCVQFPVSFNRLFLNFARFFFRFFSRKFLRQFHSTVTFFITQTVNPNRPRIIQHHFVWSHLAVVCNVATASMESAQIILDQYKTFHPPLIR